MVKDHSDSERGNLLLQRRLRGKKGRKEMFYLTTHSTYCPTYDKKKQFPFVLIKKKNNNPE